MLFHVRARPGKCPFVWFNERGEGFRVSDEAILLSGEALGQTGFSEPNLVIEAVQDAAVAPEPDPIEVTNEEPTETTDEIETSVARTTTGRKRKQTNDATPDSV